MLDTDAIDSPPAQTVASGADASPGSEPTPIMYGELLQAYHWFNRALFQGRLPPVMVTLARKANTFGYYNHAQWVDGAGTRTGEITLNPAYLAVRSIASTLAELVHQMVHAAQHVYGKPGRPKTGGHYHNKEFAAWSEEIGLFTTDDGSPTGARQGENVTYIILEGGRFEQAVEQLLTEAYRVSWLDRFPAGQPGEHEMRRMAAPAIAAARLEAKQAAALPVEAAHDEDEVQAEEGSLAGAVPRVQEADADEDGEDWLGLADAHQAEAQPLMEAAGEAAREAIQLRDEGDKKPSKRVKYACPGCKKSYWGARGGDLTCNPCQQSLVMSEPGAGKATRSAADEDEPALDQAA